MGGNGEGVFYMNKKDNIYKRETDIDGKYLDNINHVRRNGYKRNIQKECSGSHGHYSAVAVTPQLTIEQQFNSTYATVPQQDQAFTLQ